MDCIFCKIVAGKLPSHRVYEDADTLAFLDINPINPGHTLVIPKAHKVDLFDTEDTDWKAIASTVRIVAHKIEEALKPDGVNIAMNNRAPAGQVVFHAHVHVIPRKAGDGYTPWHGSAYKEGEALEILKRLGKAS